MSRLTPSRFMFALLLVAAAIMLQAPDAFAIATDISTENFSCSGGIASGNLFVSGAACPTSLTMDNVFSFLVCNFERLSSNIMGHMYCGMIRDLAPSVMVALTLAITIYGVMFTFGMIPATGQEALKFTLKCAFIVAFATNADYLIGIAYRGALAAISEGANIAVGLIMVSDSTAAMCTSGDTTQHCATNGAQVYAQLDGFLSKLFHNATDYLGATATEEMCKNAVFAVLATMFVIFPLLAYMGILLVARIIMTFFRAVFAYIYAVVGITFVLLLAPFFLVFAMFKLTTSLFERWLGYLTSFALQVVLLFSFLAFIFSMHLEKNQVVANLTNVIMYNAEQAEASSFRLPFSYCTVCDFKVVDKDDESKILTDTDKDYIAKGKLVCVDHTGEAQPPKQTSRDIKGPDGTVIKTIQIIPIRPTVAVSPDSKDQLGSLLSFAGNGILSLIILALIIEHLLKLIPSLAQKLASSMNASYATQLGGGTAYYTQTNVTQMPGQSLINDATAGFNRGFERDMRSNGFSATASGIKESLYGLTTGKTSKGGNLYNNSTERQPDGQSLDPKDPKESGTGLGGALGRYLSDPSKFGQ